MDPSLVERLRSEMRYEFARTAPPEGFPAFPDIPIGRYTSDEFYDLERKHLWPNAWVLAGRTDDLPNPGDFLAFDRLNEPVILAIFTLLFQNVPVIPGPLRKKPKASLNWLQYSKNSSDPKT